MSGAATAIVVGKVIDTAILVILGDKVSAEKQRELNRIIQDAIDVKITDKEAYDQARFKDGDALDQLLP